MMQMSLFTNLQASRRTQAWLQSFEEVSRNFAKASENWAKDKSDENHKALLFQSAMMNRMLELEK